MWQEKLKEAGISIHIAAAGAGIGLPKELWEVPGASAYLSGASFPYSKEEQAEFLGFVPEKFCSKQHAIDMASAAYMKAFIFGGKKPIGIGIAANVATTKTHRANHEFFTCIISDDKAIVDHAILVKGEGSAKRHEDGAKCDFDGLFMLLDMLNLTGSYAKEYEDVTEEARKRFFMRPFFAADGTRHGTISDTRLYALLPGSFNPPHAGHFGMANAFINDVENTWHDCRSKILFETTTNPCNKPTLSIQDLLKRARMLNGKDRIFTNVPLFIDKIKMFPGMPLIMGADTLDRSLDKSYGVEPMDLIMAANSSGNIFVANRMVDGQLLTVESILAKYSIPRSDAELIHTLPGQWDISSTELRNKLVT
jgi:nicotinic acid mononucleotide adenylyltransferase/nicotinamide mononucleotide (NMN) deamidase PncC